MPYVKKNALPGVMKLAVLSVIAVGGFVYAEKMLKDTPAEDRVKAMAHQTLDTADAGLMATKTWSSETKATVKTTWQETGLTASVKDLQIKARPLGNRVKGAVAGKSIPGTKSVAWGNKNMSLPALLLIFVFGGVAILMGMSGPVSRLGGRH